MSRHNFNYISIEIINFFKIPKKTTSNPAILKYIFLLFLGWRLILFFITFLGLSALPNLNFYTKELFFPSPELDYWTRWANWDGKAYQDIANLGYQPVLTVFFPAFPILIKALTLTGLSSFQAGFLISNTALILAMFFMFKLVKLDFDSNVAKRALFALVIFPASFYFVTLYNESLALFTTVSAFYFARQKRWVYASFFASTAALTRLTGVAVIIGVLFEYLVNYNYISKNNINISFLWQTKIRRFFIYFLFLILFLNILPSLNFLKQHLLIQGLIFSVLDLIKLIFYPLVVILLLNYLRSLLKYIQLEKFFSKNLIYLLLSITPISLYFLYQKINFNSFFSFLSYESVWGKYFSLPWNGPLNSLQFLINNLFTIGEYSARIHLRFGIFVIALVGLIISFRKLRLSYAIFYLVALIVPLFSGTLIDFPRYSLIFFPLFIVLGLIKNEIVQKIGIMISISLLAFLSILFLNSYFFM